MKAVKVEAYYNIDSLTESVSVFRLRRKPRLKLFESCDISFFPACFAIRRFGGRPVQTSALEYIFSHPDVGLRYNWETGWRLGSYFPLGRVLNWQHLSWPSTLTPAWLWGSCDGSSPRPSVRDASIFQFARGINWRWLSRAARRRRCVNSPSGAQKRLVDCCRRD